MRFGPFLVFLQRNKPTIASEMTTTPRAAPRPIVASLFELGLLAFVKEGPGAEAEGTLVEVGIMYGAIVDAIWKPSFCVQHVVF